MLQLHLYSTSTLKVKELGVKVEQDHAQCSKNKAKDI